ncbi:MAG TPA: GTPase Era [Burkholderiales bacterium]|nr:GTPase Era [Burkholderiales bacterium]
MPGSIHTRYRSGLIAVVGRPNVGKSTLLNRLIGQKISITSRKPQTTRHRITGILTREDAQYIFVDTPGFQTRHGGALNRILNRSVVQSLDAADAVLFVIEAMRYNNRDREVLELLPERPVVLVMNKIDRLESKTELLPLIQKISKEFSFAGIVPVSAQKGTQLAELLETVRGLLPENPALYPEDAITDRNERFLAAEELREKIFQLSGEEVPYAVSVTVDEFKMERGLRRIQASIIVDKPGQKAILIGAKGEKLKTIATRARKDMEKLFGGKVFLQVWVKVKSGWADDAQALKKLGYE